MRFSKSILSFSLAVALAASLYASAFAAQPGFGNFSYSGNYIAGQFSDVRATDWFSQSVEDAYNFGFFRGKSDDKFDPGGFLTLGEAVTLAARLRSIYHTGKADFDESSPFYSVYADYAVLHGITDGHDDYGARATRARFTELVFRALPPDALPAIRAIPDYGVCDVAYDTDYCDAVYALYRAGVLTGSDRYGTFYPDSNITRAEACAVMVRLAVPTSRTDAPLPGSMPADVIFQRSMDAVFLLETFSGNGRSIRTGSGFFISGSGLAVTNLHVFDNAASATITMYNGDVYPVKGIHAINEDYNLAIFSIDSEAGSWSFLKLADSDQVEAGNTVYTLGSPRALINTISEGIISNPNRVVDGETFIQFTAPISFGSGGSPVLNTLGQVVGVASSSFPYGQNLNLAVPVNYVKMLEPGECIKLSDLLED